MEGLPASAWSCVADKTVKKLGFTTSGVPPKHVVVNTVAEDGWASRKRIQPGDILLAVNKKMLKTLDLDDYKKMLLQRPVELLFVCDPGELETKEEKKERLFERMLPPLGSTVRISIESGMHLGKVRYTGTCDFQEGEVVGVELEKNHGNSDGTVGDRTYFSCAPYFGLFVHPSHVQVLVLPNGTAPGDDAFTTATEDADGSEQRGKDGGTAGQSAGTPAALPKRGTKVIVRIGEQVLPGVVRYRGTCDFADGAILGVQLKGPYGNTDGMVLQRRYFQCHSLHGVFCRPGNILVVSGDEKPAKAVAWVEAEDAIKRAAFDEDRFALPALLAQGGALGVSAKVLDYGRRVLELPAQVTFLTAVNRGESQARLRQRAEESGRNAFADDFASITGAFPPADGGDDEEDLLGRLEAALSAGRP